MRVDEQVYQRHLAAEDRLEAADRALRLTMEWLTRGDIQVGTAWLNRASHLLRDLPPCFLHGYLTYVEAAWDLEVTGDAMAAQAAAAEVERLSGQFADPALGSFALVLAGLAAVRRGDTADGFAHLDEAMLPVLAGQVDALWSGDIYCTVIHLCDELGDLARMRSWTDALARWSGRHSETFMFAGVTRIHELQLIAAEGDWDVVEQELGQRSADLVGAHGWLAGEGYYALGDVRRLRGDAVGAREAFAMAGELARIPQPGEALLLHAEGRAADALAALRIALAEQTRLQRAATIPAAVEIALELHDTSYASTLAAELRETAAFYGTPGLVARAAQSQGALLMADHRAAEALELLEQAAQIYRKQRHRYAMARVHEQLADAREALGESGAAAAERATALAIYRQLGATPDVVRMTEGNRPCGLTEREVQVLAQVSAGLTNKEVARALVISEKTVSRHLVNIFAKTGVTSRTAAAAWAHEHRLA
jgi:DNA-binding NarL/FixJ family response regulator